MSCSVRSNTPVILHDVETRTIVFSHCVDEFVRNIVPIMVNEPTGNKTTDKNFMLYSKNKIFYIKQNELHSIVRLQNMQRFEALSDINSAICIATRIQLPPKEKGSHDDSQEKPVDAYEEEESELSLAVLTGHVDGKVVLWDNLVPSKVVIKCESGVVDICILKSSIVIATSDGIIEFWSLGFKTQIKQIDIKLFSFKLMSHSIKNLVMTNKNLYFNTYGGDFIKLKLNFVRDKNTGKENTLTFREKRTKNVVTFTDNWASLCVLEKNDEKFLFIAGQSNSSVYGFSTDSHELIDIFQVPNDEIVTCMDAILMEDINPIFVYGIDDRDDKGKVLLRKNWSQSPQMIELDRPVSCIKFSPDNEFVVCATIGGTIYCLKQQDGQLKFNSRKPAILEREYPICINFFDQGNIVILSTNHRKHYKLNIKSPEKIEELEEKDKFNMSISSLIFASQTAFHPAIIGQELEYIVSPRQNCLEIWKSIRDVESSCGIKAFGHASDIATVQVANSKDQLYSLGKLDNCLIEWKVDYELSNTTNEYLKKSIQNKSSPLDDPNSDESKIQRELMFCASSGERVLDNRDSMALFRGSTVKLVNALNHRENQPFNEESFVQKRVPGLSVSLTHVYGMESYLSRKSLHFLHYYSTTEKSKITDPALTGPQAEIKNMILPDNYLREMLFSKYTPIPYDQKHVNCEKYMAYFCSRIAIVSKCSSSTLSQKFYEGHRGRISCMCVHPSKLIVATGEAEYNAEIHVWSMIDCCLMKKIQSSNLNGCINLAFSFDGLYLISVGTVGK